jgi:predicted nucleic acid-binding Zn ribbon protein
MKPVGRAVERLLRGLGIASDVERVAAIDAWPAVAAHTLGPDAAAAKAIAVEGTTLIVAVPTSGWASEIRLRERELVAALARSAPKSGVRSIRTVPGRSSHVPA